MEFVGAWCLRPESPVHRVVLHLPAYPRFRLTQYQREHPLTGRDSHASYDVDVLRGRCACKAIAFEVSDEFVVAYICHCSNCRAATGSAFLPWGEIEPEKLRVMKGADALMLIGDARGHHARRCEKCFSLVFWTGYEGRIRVPYGSLIDAPALKPTAHMFVGSKASWHEILDDLPQHDESPWS